MQLPFVLQSAEVMKTAVAYLEPHMEKTDEDGKGRIVLATVKGDVHDIGKNLVDIILSNNGYDVINLGIKQPMSAILEAATDNRVDVIGMSGLLVKSTVIMKENLEELNSRGFAGRWPVLLGGAALTRAVRRAGPRGPVRGRGPLRARRVRGPAAHGRHDGGQARREGREAAGAARAPGQDRGQAPGHRAGGHAQAVRRRHWTTRSRRRRSGATGSSRASRWPSTPPTSTSAPPSWASGVSRRRAAATGPSYEELIETEGRPRMRMWLDRIQTDGLVEAGIVYGYFPCVSEGDDLVVLHDDGSERTRFTFPRQRRDRHLCLADFFRPRESGETDVIGFQLVTVGNKVSETTQELFEKNAYRDYLELHGLSVQLAEALAEYWHTRVRSELGFGGEDPDDIEEFFKLGYRGARFSLGYGACPDLEDRAKIVELLKPGAHRRDPVGGVPARPRAVHRRDHHPPPRGEVLQHLSGRVDRPHRASGPVGPSRRLVLRRSSRRRCRCLRRSCSTWTGCSWTPNVSGSRPRPRSWPGSAARGGPSTRSRWSAARSTARSPTCST